MAQPKALVPPPPARLLAPADPVERERVLVEAEAEIDAGQGIAGDEVEAWLRDLADNQPRARPCGR